MKKLISILMISTLLAPAVLAKQKGDWNQVKALALAHYSIGVETKIGETYFGLLESVDDSSITVQIADQDDFTPQEISFQRGEVAKVWLAQLRFGEHYTAKAAWIGAGAGLAAGFATAGIRHGRGSTDPEVGMEVGVFPVYGAAAGALVGAFWKKKHKKQKLVYSA